MRNHAQDEDKSSHDGSQKDKIVRGNGVTAERLRVLEANVLSKGLQDVVGQGRVVRAHVGRQSLVWVVLAPDGVVRAATCRGLIDEATV